MPGLGNVTRGLRLSLIPSLPERGLVLLRVPEQHEREVQPETLSTDRVILPDRLRGEQEQVALYHM